MMKKKIKDKNVEELNLEKNEKEEIKIPKINFYKKGDLLYGLYYLPRSKSFYFPFKIEIVAVEIKKTTEIKYYAKILKFYDDINFLKRYFMYSKVREVPVSKSYNKKDFFIMDKSKVSRTLSKSVLMEVFSDVRNIISFDPMNVFKEEKEMLEVFNELQNYIILDSLRDFLNLATRDKYFGSYRIKYKKQFLEHNKNFLKTDDMTEHKWINFILKNNRRYNTYSETEGYFL